MSKLKQIREQQNLTQEELAEKSGISVRTIQRIESGTEPKGHTLKALSKSLEISQNELLNFESENLDELPTEKIEQEELVDYPKIKFINLSSLFFVIVPPFNILVPLIISYVLKQKNQLTKQIISLQILWTILAPIIFMLGIFMKLGNSFTIVLLIVIVLSNIFLVLRNLAEIDRKKRLRYRLNFSMI